MFYLYSQQELFLDSKERLELNMRQKKQQPKQLLNHQLQLQQQKKRKKINLVVY
jgi:hypothetical protein